jgi:predicted amidophosphoribosyltransferase
MALLRQDVCHGCQQGLGPLCPTCRRAFRLASPSCFVGEFAVASAATYAPPLSSAIIAFKDRGQWTLRHELSRLLARTVAHLWLSTSAVEPESERTIVLVPVAASSTAIRQRDADVIGELAGGAARILSGIGLPVSVKQLLVLRRPHHDNVGLSRAQRLANMADAFAVSTIPEPSWDVILVDDVVTTGATLLAARSALLATGMQVRGAAVLAAARFR